MLVINNGIAPQGMIITADCCFLTETLGVDAAVGLLLSMQTYSDVTPTSLKMGCLNESSIR